MAINPFSGIIDSNFKSIFNDAISSMLDSTACTVPCTLKYGVTKYDSCANSVSYTHLTLPTILLV